MSSIYKGHEIEKIPIKPYHLREVTKGTAHERSDPPVFQGMKEVSDPSGDSQSTPSLESVEAVGTHRERIDQVEKEAYEEAFELGEKAGAERGERMFRTAVQSLIEAAEELKRMQGEFYRRVEREILDLVIATTRKVVHREVDDQRDMILHVLKEAIAKTIDRERIRVRINPADFDFVHAHKSDIVQAIDGIKHLVIERDEAISRGGAIVESDYGTIDATIERRLEEVEKALKRQVGGKTGSQAEPRPGKWGNG